MIKKFLNKKIGLLVLFVSLAGISNAAGTDDFVTVWRVSANDLSITIPTHINATYNYNVDCNNDGIINLTGQTGDAVCTYTAAGDYTVRISGDFPHIYFNDRGDKLKIIDINQWGTGVWSSFESAFFGALYMTVTATDIPNLSVATDLSRMFRNARAADPDVSNWDMSGIITVQDMYRGAWVANPDVSNWDLSSMIDLGGMFFNTYAATPDVSKWNTSTVQSIGSMFYNAVAADPDVSNWDTSNLRETYYAFASSRGVNPDVSNWDTSNITNMFYMFFRARDANPDLSGWDVSNVTTAGGALYESGMSVENYDAMLQSWSTQKLQPSVELGVTGLAYCNTEARNTIAAAGWSIYGDRKAGAFDCAEPTDFFVTTWDVTADDLSITIPTHSDETYNYDVDCDADGVADLRWQNGDATCTYPAAGTYTVHIAGDFPRIYFNNAGDKDKIQSVEQWGTGRWTNFNSAFAGTSQLVVPATDIPDLSLVTSLESMFENTLLANPDTSGWNTSTITNMSFMFNTAISATPDTSRWNTRNVTDMTSMFFGATSANPDVSGWDTGNLQNTLFMFFRAPVANPDMSRWNIRSLTNASNMLDRSGLSKENYNQMLAGWSGQTVQPNVVLGVDELVYCNPGDRSVLTSAPNNWTIIGDTEGLPSECLVILDIDNNGKLVTDEDGLLLARYFELDRFPGDTLIDGVIGNNATRTTTSEVLTYLNSIRPLLDADGNGIINHRYDAVLIVRYISGLRGADLIIGGVESGATRNTPELLESYIGSLATPGGAAIPPAPSIPVFFGF